MEFQKFNLHHNVMAGVKAASYETPTPIQKQAIPPILKGSDVMGLAQTGTGKTAAFVLPILHKLMEGHRGHIRALIIAPTRELAEQIHETIQTLGRETRLRSITVYGGVSIVPQIHKLKTGIEIVVACPGRLLDHIKQRTINLTHIDILVLDEADRMFDMGFLPDIRRIIRHIPERRQTLMFSATMPSDIRKLAHEVLQTPITVQVDHSAPANTVAHALYPVPQHLKTALLLELLRHTNTDSVLIFTRTKHRAKRLGEHLEKVGYLAVSIQGNLSQNKRQAALDGFRKGTYQILVATDIAARGIDVSTISHVINYDIPDTADAYTHRIGRTGRAAKTGDAFTFVTPEDNEMVRTIERVLGEKVEKRMLEGFDYKKPGMAIDRESSRQHRESYRPKEQHSSHNKNTNAGKSEKNNPQHPEKKKPFYRNANARRFSGVKNPNSNAAKTHNPIA